MSKQLCEVFGKAYDMSATMIVVSLAEHNAIVHAMSIDDESYTIANLLDTVCAKHSVSPGWLITAASACVKFDRTKDINYDDTPEQLLLKHVKRLIDKYDIR